VIGAIAGDIIGSIYEWQRQKTTHSIHRRHCFNVRLWLRFVANTRANSSALFFRRDVSGIRSRSDHRILESSDFESAIRNAISLGGDADTQACIAGGLAEAFYGEIPKAIYIEVERRLSADLIQVVERFRAGYL
jgi:ADP-ribosylglycohydrolase